MIEEDDIDEAEVEEDICPSCKAPVDDLNGEAECNECGAKLCDDCCDDHLCDPDVEDRGDGESTQ